MEPGRPRLRIVRQRLIDALADAARRAGAEILTGSEAIEATPQGELRFTDGRARERRPGCGADGVNSKIRDGLALLARRKAMPDAPFGSCSKRRRPSVPPATQVPRSNTGRAAARILYTPCGDAEIYVALTMLDKDAAAKATPIDVCAVERGVSPHLSDLVGRIG